MSQTYTPETLRVLEEARALIAKPWQWLQGPVAQNRRREDVPAGDPKACRFCALGAIWHVLGGSHNAGYTDYSSIMERNLLNGRNLALFNDDERTTHADVLAVFDRAIASARAQLEVSP